MPGASSWELFLVFIFPFLFRNRDKRDKDKGKYFKTLQDLITLNWKERRELVHGSYFSFLFFLFFLEIETKETKTRMRAKGGV